VEIKVVKYLAYCRELSPNSIYYVYFRVCRKKEHFK